MAHRTADVYVDGALAGRVEETETGYRFRYDKGYAESPAPQPVSLTLPLSTLLYESPILFPFFDGLIPEGWLLDIAEKTWKLDPRDRMGLLLACCADCIGNVSVVPEGRK